MGKHLGGWGVGGSSAGRISGGKARRNTDTGLIHRCGEVFFLPEPTFSAGSYAAHTAPFCAC